MMMGGRETDKTVSRQGQIGWAAALSCPGARTRVTHA